LLTGSCQEVAANYAILGHTYSEAKLVSFGMTEGS